jgi:uncharacterized membrane protein
MATQNRGMWLAAGAVVVLAIAFGTGFLLGSAGGDDRTETPTPSVSASGPAPGGSPTAEPSPSPTPTPSPALADGRHFAFIVEIADDGTTMLTFDLAYFLTGEEAAQAAADHGDESPPPNDYYIVNDNPRLRTMPVADDPVVLLLDGGSALLVESDLPGLQARLEEQGAFQNGSWLTITAGVIVQVEEQYRP